MRGDKYNSQSQAPACLLASSAMNQRRGSVASSWRPAGSQPHSSRQQNVIKPEFPKKNLYKPGREAQEHSTNHTLARATAPSSSPSCGTAFCLPLHRERVRGINTFTCFTSHLHTRGCSSTHAPQAQKPWTNISPDDTTSSENQAKDGPFPFSGMQSNGMLRPAHKCL